MRTMIGVVRERDHREVDRNPKQATRSGPPGEDVDDRGVARVPGGPLAIGNRKADQTVRQAVVRQANVRQANGRQRVDAKGDAARDNESQRVKLIAPSKASAHPAPMIVAIHAHPAPMIVAIHAHPAPMIVAIHAHAGGADAARSREAGKHHSATAVNEMNRVARTTAAQTPSVCGQSGIGTKTMRPVHARDGEGDAAETAAARVMRANRVTTSLPRQSQIR
jgi:hypothetical protein